MSIDKLKCKTQCLSDVGPSAEFRQDGYWTWVCSKRGVSTNQTSHNNKSCQTFISICTPWAESLLSLSPGHFVFQHAHPSYHPQTMGCLPLRKLRPGSSSSSNGTRKSATATAEKEQKPIYRPTPTHARVDAIMGVPSIYRADDGVAVKEQNEKPCSEIRYNGTHTGRGPSIGDPTRNTSYSNLSHGSKPPRERPEVRRIHSAGGGGSGSLYQRRRRYPSSPLANNGIFSFLELLSRNLHTHTLTMPTAQL